MLLLLEQGQVAVRGDRPAVDRRRRVRAVHPCPDALGSLSPGRDRGAGLVRGLRGAAVRSRVHAAPRLQPRLALHRRALGDDGAEVARADGLVGVRIPRDEFDSPPAAGHADVGVGVHEQVVAQLLRNAEGDAARLARRPGGEPHVAPKDVGPHDHPRLRVRTAEPPEVEPGVDAVEIEDVPQVGGHDDRIRAVRAVRGERVVEVVQPDRVAFVAAAGQAIVGIVGRRPRGEGAAAQGAPLERVARHGRERRFGREQRQRGKREGSGSANHQGPP